MSDSSIIKEVVEGVKEAVSEATAAVLEIKEAVFTPDKIYCPEGIDYNKLAREFGVSYIDEEILTRFEKLTKKPLHPFLKRGIFYSHRDLGLILDAYEKGQKFYLYTGRGPSADSFHIGHLVPFMFTQYLQEAFDVPVVIQITDDEKYLKQEITEKALKKMTEENVKDIIACGFHPDKTFIFCDTEYMGYLYPTVMRVQKLVTNNQVRGIFGLTGSDNIGSNAFPAIQAAPSFPSSFIPAVFPYSMSKALCLIPCGIDQDPYFRMTRDVAPRLKCNKPALIHSKFIPALQGVTKKMSSSDPLSSIFLTDNPNIIKGKINKHAFSGGGVTLEEQKEKGANLEVDIPHHYLSAFLTDHEEMDRITRDYKSGVLGTGTVKTRLIQVLTDLVKKHQDNKAKITKETIQHFCSVRQLKIGTPTTTTPVATDNTTQNANN
eukprot:TRINITY_DN467_c0_g1_i2.p1 TRINITY_DN467_c0_g1~~TRINITY_DN467_c0_g1_i2.p1  ORF type:complete len:434 (+),score=70.36 TRINITY_DN467_c0_g1_i2:87-1388(+)